MMASLSQNRASLLSVRSAAGHDPRNKRSAELGWSHGPSSNPGIVHGDVAYLHCTTARLRSTEPCCVLLKAPLPPTEKISTGAQLGM